MHVSKAKPERVEINGEVFSVDIVGMTTESILVEEISFKKP